MTENTSLVEYIRQPSNLAQFEQVLGKGANSYVQSVAIAVKENPALQDCSYESIVNAALRSASLGLSCDPSQRQAYIVPRSKKVKGSGYVKVAQFQPHYNGLYTLAQRTGKYWFINVSPIYAGQEVFEDVYTGLHVFKIGEKSDGTPLFGSPENVNRYRVAKPQEKGKVIGYLGYFKTKKGFEKSVYMSIEEIEKHAKSYSESYDSEYSLWNDKNKNKPVMQMKTVLIALLKWADLSGAENALLNEALSAEEEMIDAETVEESPVEPPITEESENIQVVEEEVSELTKKHKKIMDLYAKIKERGSEQRKQALVILKKYEPSRGDIREVTDFDKLKEAYEELRTLKNKKEN